MVTNLKEGSKLGFAAKPASLMRRKDKIEPWLFVLPGIIFTLVLRYIPIFQSVWFSFHDYDIVNPPGKFVGLDNFITILTRDASFIQSWKNSLMFFLLSLLITFAIPIIQAVFLSEVFRGRSLFSAIYIIPAMIPGTIYIVLWKWIWNPSFGIANVLLESFNIPPSAWLSNPSLVKFCIVFPGIIGGGFMVLYYLAAILAIPSDIYEAAALDGCTGFKKVWHIVLPNIRFLILINLILCFIGVMQEFDKQYQYTKGGPAGSAFTIGIYIFDQYFTYMKIGKSSAAAVLLFLVILVLTVIQQKLSKSVED